MVVPNLAFAQHRQNFVSEHVLFGKRFDRYRLIWELVRVWFGFAWEFEQLVVFVVLWLVHWQHSLVELGYFDLKENEIV